MKIFYYNSDTDESVEGSEAIEASVDQAIQIFRSLESGDTSFFGMVDASDRTLQFANENGFRWLVDIPSPPDFINDQMFASSSECVAIIQDTYARGRVEEIPGMRKVDIKNQGLDDVVG